MKCDLTGKLRYKLARAERLLEGIAWYFGVYEEPWVNWVRFGAILLATIIALVRSKKMWEMRTHVR